MKKYKIMTAAAAVALLLTGCGEQSGTITTITVSETETISENEMTSVSETSHTEERYIGIGRRYEKDYIRAF